jgi:hypothetical protein
MSGRKRTCLADVRSVVSRVEEKAG